MFSALKMETTRSSEPLVSTYQSIRRQQTRSLLFDTVAPRGDMTCKYSNKIMHLTVFGARQLIRSVVDGDGPKPSI